VPNMSIRLGGRAPKVFQPMVVSKTAYGRGPNTLTGATFGHSAGRTRSAKKSFRCCTARRGSVAPRRLAPGSDYPGYPLVAGQARVAHLVVFLPDFPTLYRPRLVV